LPLPESFHYQSRLILAFMYLNKTCQFTVSIVNLITTIMKQEESVAQHFNLEIVSESHSSSHALNNTQRNFFSNFY
jgi:hypothetical protein